MTKLTPLFLLWCACSTATTYVAAQSVGRESMSGLNEVLILVESINAEAVQNGLRASNLQYNIENQLRRAGIKVVSHAEDQPPFSLPTLYVAIHTLRSRQNSKQYFFCIEIHLRQEIFLKRAPGKIVPFVATYEVNRAIGQVNESELKDLTKDVSEGINIFINDFFAVNPR
jgi:hypothetical protein